MRRLMSLATLSLLAGCGVSQTEASSTQASPAESNVVEFHIAAGTGNGAWNTQDAMMMLKVGDTLRVYNDDSVHHRLHTNGKPCDHGPEILPGASFDCVVSKAYDPAADGVLYDHYVGPSASFWIKAVAAAPEANVVEFRIPAGTGNAAWNSQDAMVMLNMGDTLRIINDDTVHHRLHTNGKPCAHGPEILPGASFDCVISRSYDPATDGALYDHYVGEAARFWIKTN